MEWIQLVIFFIGVLGLFIWNRVEARSDARHMDSKLESQRSLILEVHRETDANIKAIHEEMKDFHGRLCAIEERNKINQ
jgi:hypothetical protein